MLRVPSIKPEMQKVLHAGCLGEAQRLTPQAGSAPKSPRDGSWASTATWRRPRGRFDAMERAAGPAARPQPGLLRPSYGGAPGTSQDITAAIRIIITVATTVYANIYSLKSFYFIHAISQAIL